MLKLNLTTGGRGKEICGTSPRCMPILKNELDYQVSRFPDGQQSVRILSSNVRDMVTYGVRIDSRLSSFSDLELIICTVSALRGLGVKTIDLYIPYLLGARSDRRFRFGDPHYMRDVIAPIINSLGFQNVLIMDPHSDVTEACIDNLVKLNNHDLVKWALTQIDNTNDARKNVTIISPDAGALKKIYDVVEHFEIPNLIVAFKHRDLKTGEITHTEVPIHPQHAKQKFVIIDDICDGGRTFIEIAKVIRGHFADAEIYLIATHGIFSKGTEELGNWFTEIFTTNSVRDLSDMDDFVQVKNVF
jgi:ribose-phosphate pyrophosphokinase